MPGWPLRYTVANKCLMAEDNIAMPRKIFLTLVLCAALFSSLRVEGAVGKLVACDMVVTPDTAWRFPVDSLFASVEVRGRLLHRRNPGSAGVWSLGFTDADGRRLVDVNVVKREGVDDYHPASLSVSATGYDANGLPSGDLQCAVGVTDGINADAFITVSVVRDDDGMALISVGEESLQGYGMLPLGGVPGFLVLSGDAPFEIESVNLKKSNRAVWASLQQLPLEAVFDRLAKSTDVREGIYEYLDSDIDTEQCQLGGHYRLAVVADGKGGYDIFYLSGAEENASAWSPGMRKGGLVATGFLNHFNLEWMDVELDGGMEEMWGILDGLIMELHFPREKATVRFSRSRLGR